jgi:hypothetical protein
MLHLTLLLKITSKLRIRVLGLDKWRKLPLSYFHKNCREKLGNIAERSPVEPILGVGVGADSR